MLKSKSTKVLLIGVMSEREEVSPTYVRIAEESNSPFSAHEICGGRESLPLLFVAAA